MTLRGAFGSLSLPQYRWFILSAVASGLAFQSQQIAMGWLAYALTKSPFALGLVLTSWGISQIAFSLIGGHFADSRSRRHTMAVSMAVSAAAASVIGILVTADLIALWHLLVAGAVSGTAYAFNATSRQAFVFDVVGREHIGDAVAIQAGAMNAMRLVSPALAGFLIGAIGVDASYYLVALCYLISVLTVLLPLRRVNEIARKSGHPARELADGFRYIRREKMILWLLVVALATMLVGLPFRNLMPAFAVESLGQGPEGYGLLMSMVGLGAVLGGLGVIFLGKLPRKRLLVTAAAFGWGISLMAFSMSSSLAVAALFAVILGMTSLGTTTLNSVLLNTEVDDTFRGRVLSFWILIFSISLAGTLPIGGLAEMVGTATVLTWSGPVLMSLSIALALWGRKIVTYKPQRLAGVEKPTGSLLAGVKDSVQDQ